MAGCVGFIFTMTGVEIGLESVLNDLNLNLISMIYVCDMEN